MSTENAEPKAPVDRLVIWASVVAWYDRMMYRLAFPSLQRMCLRNPGIAYLFELHLRRHRERNPISDSLMRSTETFLDAMEDLQNI